MYSEGKIMDAVPKIKYSLSIFFSVFFIFASGTERDTLHINALTRQAYNNARTSPRRSIRYANKALSASGAMPYPKGIADANLALGAAYLARFNPGDSAAYFYHRALEDYTRLKDFRGMARACYGLSFLNNFKSCPGKALTYGNQSVEYFEKAGSQAEVLAALEAVIFLEKQKGHYERALKLSDKAITIARSVSDTLHQANALNNKGNVFKDMFLFNQAIDAYFEAFKLWELKKDTAGLAIAYGSIANACFFEGDYEKSLEYNFKKLPLTKNACDHWETNKTLKNIALSFSKLNKTDSALAYMKESLGIACKMNYPEGMASSYNNLASVFLNHGDADSALFYSSEAIAISKKIKSPKLGKYKLNKAMALHRREEYNSALKVAQKAYNMIKEKNDNLTLRDASFLLSEIYYSLNRRDLAYPFLTEYLQLNDSIMNMDYMRKVTRLDIQHEYNKKERQARFEIEMLDKSNQLKAEKLHKSWILLIALLLLSLTGAIISMLFIHNKNHRIEKMNLEIRNYLFQLEKLKKGSNSGSPVNDLAKNYGLTHRETEIMQLMATGIGNEEIAGKLFVSKNTIKFHIKNIFIKLDVRNRVQALQKMAG